MTIKKEDEGMAAAATAEATSAAETAKTPKTRTTLAQATVEIAEPKVDEPLMYIGPNLLGGRLMKFTVFKGGKVPLHLEDLLKCNPDIQTLIVPTSETIAAQLRTQEAGTAEYAAYQKLLEQEG